VNDTDIQDRAAAIQYLRETDPAQLVLAGEAAAIAAFRRTVARVPAYRRLVVDQLGVDPALVTDIGRFRTALPLLDKHSTFGALPIRDLCIDGDIDNVRSLLTSSGHSGVFSFGVNTDENLARSARSIDMGLQYIFNVDEKRTLLINALPMGVKVHTRATVLAETSVREDMVYALVKKFHDAFDQIILVGEGSFAKKIIEDGRNLHGIDWEKIRINLVLGEEGIAENYRTYMGTLIGVDDFDDPNGKVIMSSMGVAELDLNIFHETRDTARIRRLAHRDPAVRRQLFGEAQRFCPMFFVYYPHRCYVEEHHADRNETEIVMSILSEEMKLPLLRYRTGDFGRVHSYGDVVAALGNIGHRIAPDLKLPFVSVSGRGKFIETRDGELYPEAVKEALYAVPALAARVTGNFRILQGRDGGATILFQLKPGARPPRKAKARLLEALAVYTDARPEVAFMAYQRFPYAMSVDYERKFSYI